MLALTFGPKEDNLQPMSKYIVQVLQVQSGALISTYSGHRDYIEALAWSPDGTYIASASDDTTVHIWEPKQTQATYIYRGHSARVRKVAWAPDNIHLATASEDKTLQVWKKPQ
jgi:eukaryotic-like serine/threonine-protein kinase